MEKETISKRMHKTCQEIGYKELAKILGISKSAAWQKIKNEQYTLSDLEKVFKGAFLLSRG